MELLFVTSAFPFVEILAYNLAFLDPAMHGTRVSVPLLVFYSTKVLPLRKSCLCAQVTGISHVAKEPAWWGTRLSRSCGGVVTGSVGEARLRVGLTQI